MMIIQFLSVLEALALGKGFFFTQQHSENGQRNAQGDKIAEGLGK